MSEIINIKFLYKFGKIEHLQSLMEGKVRFMNADYYHEIERKFGSQGVGDLGDCAVNLTQYDGRYEGKILLQPYDGGEPIDMTDKLLSLQFKLNDWHKLPIFCCSYAGDNNMSFCKETSLFRLDIPQNEQELLKSMCEENCYDSVVIWDANNFINSLKDNIGDVGFSPVEYLHRFNKNEKMVEANETDNWLKYCTLKDEDFSYQRELRIVIPDISLKIPYVVTIGNIKALKIFSVEEFFNIKLDVKYK